jgi:hypothetical protein
MARLFRKTSSHLDSLCDGTDLSNAVANCDCHQAMGDSVMFTIHHGLGEHAAHLEWQPTKVMRLSVLLGTLIVASIAVNAFTILADSHLRQRTSTVPNCSAMGEEVNRLACYDNLARQPAPQPARGANAPAHFQFR